MPEELFNWAMLGTYAGTVVFTSIVTQMLKNIGFLKNIRTRLLSYAIALIILICATIFADTTSVESIALCFINAFVVAFAANGGYDAISSIAGMKKR